MFEVGKRYKVKLISVSRDDAYHKHPNRFSMYSGVHHIGFIEFEKNFDIEHPKRVDKKGNKFYTAWFHPINEERSNKYFFAVRFILLDLCEP